MRVLNDRIRASVESELTQKSLYIRYLETEDRALYDQSRELRIANNDEWNAINDAANDFIRPYLAKA